MPVLRTFILRELHSVCVLMDHPDQMQRPTETTAMRG